MHDVTLDNLAGDVIGTLVGGQAIVMGHAFGTFVTKNAAPLYPEKIPAIVVASPGGYELRPHSAEQPFIAGNTSLPTSERLAAMELAFFAPNHNANIWLSGWNTATLVMEHPPSIRLEI
jgi:pimeloyl-ACP methyl ester carboxylesterase